jgi:hypothetical protein
MLRMSMTRAEVTELATFNGEDGGGWEHSPAYRFQMAILQWRYDTVLREVCLDVGLQPAPGGGYFGVPEREPHLEFNEFLGRPLDRPEPLL